MSTDPASQGNILIVDDTPANLKVLTAILTEQGYTVRPALNGPLALKVSQKAPPDLILLDIRMPGLDGYEVCRQLKAVEQTRHIPVIFISAFANLTDKVRAFQVGGVDYITSPFQAEEVLARVSIHLTLYRLQQQLEQQVSERTAEWVKANVALRQSEVKNQALLKAIPDLMLRYSREGNYLDILPAKDFNPLLPLDQLLGKNVSEVLSPTLAQQFIQAIQQALQTQETQSFEYQLPARDGMRDFETRLVVSGQDEVLALVRNVTARKRAEQEHLRFTTMQQELKIAQDIQQSLLPPPKPDWPNLEVICYSAPAHEIGGDFYTYQHLTGNLLVEGKPALNSFALAIGDVTGKGLPAALLMAVSLASLQAVIDQSFPPGQLLTHLDQAIARYTETTRQNCALVYIEIDIGFHERTPCLRVSNAGSISPLIRRRDGSVEWVEIGGLPLGAGGGSQPGYSEMTVNLAPGDLIILTSDGVVEAMNNTGQMFGFKQLEQAIAVGPATSAAAMLAHIQAEVAAFVGGTEPHDDLTIMVARV